MLVKEVVYHLVDLWTIKSSVPGTIDGMELDLHTCLL
jgi:hypothetical protein